MKQLLLAFTASAALAQPTERVTVTGTKEPPGLAAEHFVQRFTAISSLTGKTARWEDGICPVTVGLGARYAAFITARVRDVAREAGVPVDAHPGCKANIEIVFTTTPQKLADGIAKNHRVYLGYASNSDQRATLATIRHPIQAWYTTATKDVDGDVDVDSPGTMSTEPITNMLRAAIPKAQAGVRRVTGGRLQDGLHSILYHVIIVAEPAKLARYEVGTLADYIAMLALAQIASLDTCQPLGSIINLLAKDCANVPAGLTAGDQGYLRGLYSMRADGNLRMQQDGIAQVMLEGEP